MRYWLFREWKGFEVHGKARWMNWWERRRFFRKRNDGLVFGKGRRISRAESFKNLALIAPTGSGKTTRFVIPNLLALEGSAVVTDPAGEIYQATAGHLAGRGFHIEVIQPADVSRSLRFNPLAYLQGHQELGELARTLA
ncbi:MAG: type IV secretory system conjugative DNA transfer family protein, partial [Gammaproteobacteria bacterium]